MKALLKLFVILFVLSVVITIHAEETNSNTFLKALSKIDYDEYGVNGVATNFPGIPEASWERPTNDFAITMTIVSKLKKGVLENFLKVYVKNTSDTDKYILSYSTYGGIRIYYTDSKTRSLMPLRDYGKDSLINRLNQWNVKGGTKVALSPGYILCSPVVLTADELEIVRTHLVQCSIPVTDQDLSKCTRIESTPKKLSTMTESGPTEIKSTLK